MRNPNGFGSVYKLSGARRRPWAARKTAGWNPNGQPIYTFIGYYETRKDALDALALYNNKPYDKRTTFKNVLDMWKHEEWDTFSVSTQCAYESASKRCVPIYERKISEIRLNDMQALVNDISFSLGNNVRVLLGHVFDHAVRHEIVTADRRQLVSFIKLSEDKGRTIKRTVFSADEIQRVTDPLVLILLWTGMRVGELMDLRPEDIHLEERWLFIRKSKTPAGVRVVPIAERIVPCFSSLPITVTYETFKNSFRRTYSGHLPHDTRHTFISRMADLGVDERITKAIVGHAGSGVTESVYTHMDLKPLLEAVNRL